MHDLTKINQTEIPAGLYIHVPFCLSKCAYCSFYSIKSVNLIPDYLAALCKEITFYGKYFPSVDTVYLGGGTPSLLNIGQLAVIFAALHKTYKIAAQAEITLEANPGDISTQYLQTMRSLGINRLNIGVQSFDDKCLKLLGRRHSAAEAVGAIESARQAGFSNLGIDLIYGIHGSGIKSWEKNMAQAITFAPEHISCYQLSLDARTPLYKRYAREGFPLLTENQELKFFRTADRQLTAAGYIHYEVSNFAVNEYFPSRHNTKYWRHVPYLGLGPGAHSFLHQKRWWNKSSVRTYLSEISQGRMPVDSAETLSARQLQMEEVFLGLRTKAGLDLGLFRQKYASDLLLEKKTIIEKMLARKLVELVNGVLIPTQSGLALADSLALSLFPDN